MLDLPPRRLRSPAGADFSYSMTRSDANLRQLSQSGAGSDVRHSIWSSSEFSELRPHRRSDQRLDASRLKKAHSFSTISDHDTSPSPAPEDGFRVVIDRFHGKNGQETSSVQSIPALKVPIPHFRLGVPQFNPDGTPVLRSSVYTTTTTMEDIRPDPPSRIPTTYDGPELLHPLRAFSGAMSSFSGLAPATDMSKQSLPQQSDIYNLEFPIEPSLFDSLAKESNDPSQVRYFPGTNEISAATPARIVAQISSESFMDYELVSDFFLTFRAYLSTADLLALLMARLEWAISRPQDDGRIIRIRTFAALRHWILNYFEDDFVLDRHLRILFCEKLNALYQRVKSRKLASASDIKILADLKRCWHGRCVLYWDCPDYVNPDSPIYPGGVAGSRDIVKTTLSEANMGHSDVIPGAGLGPPRVEHPRFVSVVREENGLCRKLSSVTTKGATFSPSDCGDQPVSCPFTRRRSSEPLETLEAPQPIPLQLLPHGRAGLTQSVRRSPVHSHKRSGSFSDSLRDDRAPVFQTRPNSQRQLWLRSSSEIESLIWGNSCRPVDPAVDFMAPPSPPGTPFSDDPQDSHGRSMSEGNIKPPNGTPGVRTIIGSIRRALHSKQPPMAVFNHSRMSPTSTGKTAALPANVASRSEYFRGKKASTSHKSPLRIDYLSDQVMSDYRELFGLGRNGLEARHGESGGAEGEPSLPHETKKQNRIPSQITAGSKSIVIVDDTGGQMPSIADGISGPSGIANQPTSMSATGTAKPSSSYSHIRSSMIADLSGAENGIASRSSTPRLSTASSFVRESSSERPRSISSRLRKYASFHSGISGVLSNQRNSVAGSETNDLSQASERFLGRMLRRRPGGDLRKIQNVRDLESRLRPRSFVSETTLSNSVASSAHYGPGSRLSRVSRSQVPGKYDLINTDSFHQLRPSLEAAVAEFARIPDDDDGGVETTLLKLEGKWKPRSTPAANTETQCNAESGDDSRHRDGTRPSSPVDEGNQTARNTKTTGISERREDVETQIHVQSVVESEDSQWSVPLLERGLSDESMRLPKDRSYNPSDLAAQQNLLHNSSHEGHSQRDSSHRSIQVISETESVRGVPSGAVTDPAGSESEVMISHRDARSNLSSELSLDKVEKDEVFESDSDDDLADAKLDLPPHALVHPPSPPMTIPKTSSVGPSAVPVTPVHNREDLLLTPGPSPARQRDHDHMRQPSEPRTAVNNDPYAQDPSPPSHIPFVLAYDSRLLAQQLTLVEKSALDEIDWRDLVEMKWSNQSSSARNWAQFLAEQERRGVDLVIGRFNLMVKWVLSEIVLAGDIQERARTISRFIHVAAHARRMCNYATLLQIVIALTSSDCTRLRKTWALVSPADKRLLESMEPLIKPVRNFHELRVEMETANIQNGCIPFVGKW